MHNTKTVLGAASLALLTALGIGAAGAAPWDRDLRPTTRMQMRQDMRQDMRRDLREDRRQDFRQDFRGHVMDRERVFSILRQHHYRGLGEPYFFRGHYLVRVAGRFGRPLLIEVDPYTGVVLGQFRT